jgi:hypothetical protein
MGSIFAVLGGLWFAGAALLNVAGGNEILSFPRIIYIGLGLIAFALVDWGALVPDGPNVSLPARELERPPDD